MTDNKIFVTFDFPKKDGFGSQFFKLLVDYAYLYNIGQNNKNIAYLHTPIICGRIYSGPNLITNPNYISKANIEKLVINTWSKHANNPKRIEAITNNNYEILRKTLLFDKFFNICDDKYKYSSIDCSETDFVYNKTLDDTAIKFLNNNKRMLCYVNPKIIKTNKTNKKYFNKIFIEHLRSRLTPIKSIKVTDKVRVNIHIRRGDVFNPKEIKYNNKKKQCFERLYTDDDKYLKILDNLTKYADKIEINIYSLKNNFNIELYKKYKNIKINLTDCQDKTSKDIEDLQDLINSDILFVSKSSYAKVASIYNIGYQFYNIDGSNNNLPIIKNNKMFDYSKLTDDNFIKIIDEIVEKHVH